MGKGVGLNLDFMDDDEIDDEALEAITEFEEGIISYNDLKSIVGHQEARAIKERGEMGTDETDPESFFDDIDDYDY